MFAHACMHRVIDGLFSCMGRGRVMVRVGLRRYRSVVPNLLYVEGTTSLSISTAGAKICIKIHIQINCNDRGYANAMNSWPMSSIKFPHASIQGCLFKSCKSST